MVNDAGGIKSLGGAKLNLILSDVQSDTTVTRTETDRLISGYKLSAIHGCYASALTLIASEVAERAKVPLLTGSSTDQLNQGRHYTFTPFRARLAIRAGATANGQTGERQAEGGGDIREHRVRHRDLQGPARAGARRGRRDRHVRAVLGGLVPMPARLINKVKASGANMLFPVSYLNDLILIIRAIKQLGLKIAINGGSGGFVIPDFYKNVGNLAEGLLGRGALEPRHRRQAQQVNAAYKKQYGEFLFEYAGGLVAQTFMIADALERAASPDPQKVRDALAALDFSEGYAAMCPGGKVKFGPDGKNIYAHPVGVQWQHGDLATVFPKEDARAPLMKA